jgi:uncharacterized membrane protein
MQMNESEYKPRGVRPWHVAVAWIAGFILSCVFVLRIHDGLWSFVLSICVAAFMATIMSLVLPLAAVARGRILR